MGKNKKLSLVEVISMAVGTMIGASIFSIFGLEAKIAGKDLPEAFVLSGIYALLVDYSVAKVGELPESFERKIWFKSTEGLYFTASLALLFALFFKLGAIASITSTVFTVIYIFVLISHLKLRKDYGGNRIVLIINLIILSTVFAALMKYQWDTQRNAIYGSIFIFVGAYIVEYFYRKYKKSEMKDNRISTYQQ